MGKGTFGENLRREREMRGVSLEEVANATRISTRFLHALENEQWERLPGGVFNRGFVRAVAHFLGLNEDALMAEYAQSTGEPLEESTRLDAPPRGRREVRVKPMLSILLLLTMVAGAWFAWQEAGPMVTWFYRSKVQGVRAPASRPAGPRLGQLETPVSPGVAGSEILRLKIEAGETTYVTVIADGTATFDGRMLKGENRSFQAQEKFEISVRNSSAVLMELNGQTLPPLGQLGEPGSVTLTRKDVKKDPGGGH